MAAISGYGGEVSFGGGAVVIVGKWEINDQVNLEDVTKMATAATGRKTWAPCLTEWTASFEGEMDTTETKFKGATPAIRSGATGTASFKAGALTYSGTVIIKSVKITNDVSSVLKFSVECQGQDDLTYPAS